MFTGDVTCLRGDSMEKKILAGEQITIRDEYDDTKVTTFDAGCYQAKPLQREVMKKGIIISPEKDIRDKRNYYLSNLQGFNETQRRIINPHYYKADISDDLYDLKNRLIESLINEIKHFDEN